MREDKIIKRMKNIIRKMRIRSKRPTVKEIIFEPLANSTIIN
jgi:hypothetical protein